MDRFFPSSRLCSVCGTLQQKMPLSVRTWTCDCSAAHDRDVNMAAAKAADAGGGVDRPPTCASRAVAEPSRQDPRQGRSVVAPWARPPCP
ncbi:zinc ribbon domain-containing protein [Streptomyces sp. NBC_01604]|uniref:zinc ribbon domain-containing protein n=1 Tax=Streptomyces sp. NBC_01604 TaxID=2975894 RepID=UPI0038647D6A